MKKVFLQGYWAGNLGDDLFAKIILERYPDVNFYIFANKSYKKIFKDYPNLKIINYELFNNIILRLWTKIYKKVTKVNINWIKLYRNFLIKRMDAFVVMGGSLFMENNYWEEQVELFESAVSKVSFKCILGSNFGPFRSEEFLERYKKLFKMFDDICFRDNYSYELFQDLENCRTAPDIIFQLKPPFNATLNTVAISVKNFEQSGSLKKYTEIYNTKMANIAEYYIQMGYNVKLISFCEYEGDNLAVDNIYSLLSDQNKLKTQRYYYIDNINLILQELSSSKHIISTRFHAMIIGLILKKPVFPVIYSEKMTNVLKDLGFSSITTVVENIDKITPEVIYENIREEINIKDFDIQSEKHFSKLDKFLNRRTN